MTAVRCGLSLVLAAGAVAPARGEGFSGELRDYLGPLEHRNPGAVRNAKPAPSSANPLATLKDWNRIAIDASGLDHTPLSPGETRTFGEQLGPGRASRAMAIVHIAMFEAVNAVMPKYRSYVGLAAASGETAIHAAIAQAARDTLAAMYPSQAPAFDAALAATLSGIDNKRARDLGVALGRRAAAATLDTRIDDGSEIDEPQMGTDFQPNEAAGWWRQDPISLSPVALGAHWGEVRPFVIVSSSQFRAPEPPHMDSAQYAAAFAEAKAYGGDVGHTPTIRTPEQTQIGIFWAYDGTPSLCAPPRLYNQITMRIATDRATTNVVDLARLLALVNTAMADAGIAIWESKYHYQFWRPVTGIREADAGTGPTGTGDGNAATIGDPGFTPLGAPASNLLGPNFTPPFPSYPSGHAGFGGALFQVLRRVYGTDDIAFSFTSDEFNGVTRDSSGAVRPVVTRTFAKLSQAEEENGQSRIYLGIHWSFDKSEGIAQGRNIGNWVVDHAFTPLRAK